MKTFLVLLLIIICACSSNAPFDKECGKAVEYYNDYLRVYYLYSDMAIGTYGQAIEVNAITGGMSTKQVIASIGRPQYIKECETTVGTILCWGYESQKISWSYHKLERGDVFLLIFDNNNTLIYFYTYKGI